MALEYLEYSRASYTTLFHNDSGIKIFIRDRGKQNSIPLFGKYITEFAVSTVRVLTRGLDSSVLF